MAAVRVVVLAATDQERDRQNSELLPPNRIEKEVHRGAA
jgi:hypothetical protein